MFQEFLHPELVLFGVMYNPAISISHDVATKEGEIVIHQKINRHAFDPQNFPSRQQQEFKEKQIEKIKQQEFPEQDNDMTSEPVFKKEDEPYKEQESAERQKNIQGYYQNQENPYDDEYYGFNMDAQYAPEQFGSIDTNIVPDSSPSKQAQNEHIPFTEQSPAKLSEPQVELETENKQSFFEFDAQNPILTGAAQMDFADATNDLIDEFTQM